ncbi:hypothetical protein AKJ48_03530, partial [candidate division MSBL1 archaeon SCGC-AAA261O19]
MISEEFQDKGKACLPLNHNTVSSTLTSLLTRLGRERLEVEQVGTIEKIEGEPRPEISDDLKDKALLAL